MTTRLFVLGLLAERPRHGYEIRKWLEKRRTDLWANVPPGSIYHALKKTTAEGLIKLSSTEQSGLRRRAVYAITPRGRREFRRLLREAWRRPPHSIPAGINTALSFIDELPRQEVREAIAETIAALEKDLEAWTLGEERKAQYTVMTEAIRASFINGRDHINADLRFLRRLRELLSRAE
jgi:DNA-binding PadR family transcriptional regulator